MHFKSIYGIGALSMEKLISMASLARLGKWIDISYSSDVQKQRSKRPQTRRMATIIDSQDVVSVAARPWYQMRLRTMQQLQPA